MGTKRIDKRYLWLEAIHVIEDMNGMSGPNLGPTLRALDKKFFIKKRKELKTLKKK